MLLSMNTITFPIKLIQVQATQCFLQGEKCSGIVTLIDFLAGGDISCLNLATSHKQKRL